jgi:ATP phosphoribosyltransferase regulatory subunit HisZ
MKDEVARLREERDKALAIGNQGFIRAYLEKQIGRHPRAAKVREYVLEAAPVTQDKVDELIRAYDADNPVSEEFSRISRGLQRTPKTEDNNERSLNEDTEESTVFGVPMSQVGGSL